MGRLAFFLCGIILIFFNFIVAQDNRMKVNNYQSKITICKDRVRLDRDKDWETAIEKNDAGVFSEPRNIEIGKTGDIYIVDSEMKRINVFTSAGNSLRTIGKEGIGPGEFLFPINIVLDKQDNLVIGDDGMRRVSILNSLGKSLGDFFTPNTAYFSSLVVTKAGKIILPNLEMTFKLSPLLLIYDIKGNVIGKIGQRGGEDSDRSERIFLLRNLVEYSTDSEDNIYIAYLARPLILKYSKDGKQILEISYELPFTIFKTIADRDHFIDFEGPFIKSISTDSKGYIYIVAQTRPKSGKERTIGRTMGGTYKDKFIKIRSIKADIKPTNTDLYQLLVFDNKGNIKATRQLDIYCDKIKIFGNEIFCIDTYVTHKIYKYKYSYETAPENMGR